MYVMFVCVRVCMCMCVYVCVTCVRIKTTYHSLLSARSSDSLVVNGYKMLSKWNQVGDTPLMTEVGIDLSTSLEGLDHVAVGCKHNFPLDCYTL